ncbi:MAG: tyrosine--tRNA ligase [Candidatus Nezhaarchaeota archaeon]|nr:tyrosine--tRNA ligase [Candidatus Nezhaarchaeota archaeon]
MKTKLDLASRNTEEVVKLEELEALLREGRKPKAYWGFEPSGLMHLGMGLVTGSKIKDLVEADFDFIIFLADWHAWINNKLGGDIGKIRLVGEYFKHCFTALGLSPNKVRYVWSSELTSEQKYWEVVVKVAKNSTLTRVKRALPIMGRSLKEGDVEAAWLMYPCMQVADIFYMDLDVACGGIDQRKAHMLARDVADKLGFKKPVCIHTPLLMGLEGPGRAEGFDEDARVNKAIASKMSKSSPERCIFIHDEPEEIRRKVMKAYCPPRNVEDNPLLEMVRLIIIPWRGKIDIKVKKEVVAFNSYPEVAKAYAKGDIHPLDLKEAVTEILIEILKPVRDYFKGRRELDEVKELEITR